MKARITYILPILFVLVGCNDSFCQINADTSRIGAQSSKDLPTKTKQIEEIIGIKERMPRFPGCEDQNLNDRDLEKCAKDKMLQYVYGNLIYPEKAKKNKNEGKVFLRFTIDERGAMKNLEVVRDIGDGCGSAALKVLKAMQEEITWIPGFQYGKPVKVQYVLPVIFKL